VFTNNRYAPPIKTYPWDDELEIIDMPEINTGKKIKRIEFGLVLSKEGKKKNNSKLALQKAMLGLVNRESSVVEE